MGSRNLQTQILHVANASECWQRRVKQNLIMETLFKTYSFKQAKSDSDKALQTIHEEDYTPTRADKISNVLGTTFAVFIIVIAVLAFWLIH